MSIMHFQEAVLEHARWWGAFEAFLHSDPNVSPDAAIHMPERQDVARDDRCAIGRWLHGDGERFSDLAAYQVVKKLHKELHDLSGLALNAKMEGRLELMETSIRDIHKIRHDLFMAWDILNDIIGGCD